MMLIPAISVVLLALLVAVELGHVPVRLPFPPGVEYDYMMEPPAGSLPPHWDNSFKLTDESLTKATYVLSDAISGVETVALGPGGTLGLVDQFGRIFVASPNGKGGFSIPSEPLAWSSPGRTLGVKFDADGNLYMANAPLGLLQLISPGDPENQKLMLATGRVSDESPLMAGYPVEFANSIDIAEDGTVFFTTSTDVLPYKTEHGYWETTDSVFVSVSKGAPSGMLLAYHPANGTTTCLAAGFWFTNGLALAHDESFLLFADSIQGKIHRYWLKGAKAGQQDVFVDKLPGPPDGISRALDGEHYYITIYCPPPAPIAWSGSRLGRAVLAWLPRLMRLLKLDLPGLGLVLKVDGQGVVVQQLGDPSGKVVKGITSAFESEDGRLFLGTLHHKGVPVLDLKQVPQAS